MNQCTLPIYTQDTHKCVLTCKFNCDLGTHQLNIFLPIQIPVPQLRVFADFPLL